MKINSTALITGLAFLSIFAAIAITISSLAPQGSIPVPSESSVYPTVTVVSVTPDDYQASVSGYGEAMSKYNLMLATEVSGKVEKLTLNFATGMMVKKGQILASIDKTEYQQALAVANTSLAQANLALLEEQREGELARANWRSAGIAGAPGSPFVLRKPQLKTAQTKLQQAKQQVILAQRNLHNTEISSPFDALVVERNIHEGSIVQMGSTVATLYSTDTIEIRIPLSAQSWQRLPPISSLSENYWAAVLEDTNTNTTWPGNVVRAEQHVNASTRQRALIIEVNQPLALSEPLLPGSYVSATIAGKQYKGLWKLPATAISQQGFIWYVDKNSTLQNAKVEKLIDEGEFSFINPVENINASKLVARPLNSYVKDMHVTVRLEN